MKVRTLFIYAILLFVGVMSLGHKGVSKPSLPDLNTPTILPRMVVIAVPNPIANDDITDFNKQDLNCLARNIYFESRNQSFAGQFMVGLVTLERVKNPNYPDTICGVVYQGKVIHGEYVKNHCQFSWVCDGKTDKINLKNPIENDAWNQAVSVAKILLRKDTQKAIDSDSLTNYHATYVTPSWARSRRYTRIMKIQDHIFYRVNEVATN